MKKSFVLFVLAIALSACEEEPLPIIFNDPEAPLRDSTWIKPSPSLAETKVVLLEDYTGVRCVSCPNGHKAVKDILAANPGRVVALALHPGASEFPTARPFEGEPDLNTPYATRIFGLIGKPAGLPYGTSDRVIKSNITGQWAGNVATRLSEPTPINLNLYVISYNADTRELKFGFEAEATANLPENIFFSTAITEDKIMSKQEYQGGIYEVYEHNHILRAMPHFQQNLSTGGNPEAGRTYLKEFGLTLNPDWNADNCNLVVFVHYGIEILQSKEVKIR